MSGSIPRQLARLAGRAPGPTVVCVAALHGNEPAGLAAFRRVADTLRSAIGPARGEVVGLVGNRAALGAARRGIDRDLNRRWRPARIAALRRRGARAVEDAEQLELLDALEAACRRARGPVHVVDLHTTSGDGPPFTVVSETYPGHAFALELPLPAVLGLEAPLEGTLLEYIGRRGYIGMAVEGGWHGAPRSIDHLEAALWLALDAAGVLPPNGDRRRRATRLLAGAARDTPRAVRIRHRHAVAPGDRFRMRPGFSNFQPVRSGEPLAEDATGVIRAREPGRVLLPLYQRAGDDGFFLARDVGSEG